MTYDPIRDPDHAYQAMVDDEFPLLDEEDVPPTDPETKQIDTTPQ